MPMNLSPERPRAGRMKKHNQGNLGLLAEANIHGQDRVLWYNSAGKTKREAPGRALLTLNMHEAQRARTSQQYKGQPSYHGFYWHSQLDKLIWYESLFEEVAMMWLDFRFSLNGYASQPMVLQFRDGTKHVPDFFAAHADGRQVLYDVKPQALITDRAKTQFENTQRVCDLIGWDYELFTEIDPFVRTNLRFIAGYRHPRYVPEAATRERVLDVFDTPKSYGEVIRHPVFHSPREGTFTICSLIWTHHLRFEMNKLLSEYTLIWKAS